MKVEVPHACRPHMVSAPWKGQRKRQLPQRARGAAPQQGCPPWVSSVCRVHPHMCSHGIGMSVLSGCLWFLTGAAIAAHCPLCGCVMTNWKQLKWGHQAFSRPCGCTDTSHSIWRALFQGIELKKQKLPTASSIKKRHSFFVSPQCRLPSKSGLRGAASESKSIPTSVSEVLDCFALHQTLGADSLFIGSFLRQQELFVSKQARGDFLWPWPPSQRPGWLLQPHTPALGLHGKPLVEPLTHNQTHSNWLLPKQMISSSL